MPVKGVAAGASPSGQANMRLLASEWSAGTTIAVASLVLFFPAETQVAKSGYSLFDQRQEMTLLHVLAACDIRFRNRSAGGKTSSGSKSVIGSAGQRRVDTCCLRL